MAKTQVRACAPFNFAATARFLRFNESELVDTFADACYRRALHLGGRLCLLSVTVRDADTRPVLNIELAPEKAATTTTRAEAEAARVVGAMFSIGHNLEAWRAQVVGDPLLAEVEATHRGLHLPRWPTLFEALAISILSQQISTTAAMTLKRRLVERFGEQLTVEAQTYFAFPRAEALAAAEVQQLRALGLSGAKALSLNEAARAVADGALDPDALALEDNESLIARLSELRGVGRWTAEWVLMMYFGRTDVFPAGDLFLRGTVVKYYNGGRPLGEREVRDQARRRWGAWASYAALYMIVGLRAGTVTLKPGRVLSSLAEGARESATDATIATARSRRRQSPRPR